MIRAHGLPRTVLAGLLAAFVAAACQGGTEPKIPPRDGQLIVSASVAGTPIRTLVVEVSAADISPALVFNLTLDEVTKVASGNITVPAGSGRNIRIRGYDAAGVETHRGGRDNLTIKEGANDPISISVLSLGGDQHITATISSHRVVITSPASSSADVIVGVGVAFTAEIFDAANQPVSPEPGRLKWASDAPAFVEVDENTGVVTGRLVGTSAKIMATYLGMGAQVTVNVIAAP